MGRKKRKVVVEDSAPEGGAIAADISGAPNVVPPPPPLPPPADPRRMMQQKQQPQQQRRQRVLLPNLPESSLPEVDATPNLNNSNNSNNSNNGNQKKLSSGYATTSHSAEIIDEDIYVSDGSESDEDLMADQLHMSGVSQSGTDGAENGDDSGTTTTNVAGRSIEMVLSGSKMGLMRRGIHRPQQLVQPNRQWARHTPQEDAGGERGNTGGDGEEDGDDDSEDRRKKKEEEELAKLDPAQRAARLLAEKQRKLEETKILARKLESEENAGRDPCLFSKRTSFDIRFDQIDDKPWERTGDVTDFFNYGFSEDDWLEYAEQQLLIRQELIDASRQKRLPDPSIVPVTPKKPKKQNPRVAVANANTTSESAEADGDGGDGGKNNGNIQNHLMGSPVCVVIGPEKPKTEAKDDDKATPTGAKDAAANTDGSAPAASDDFVDLDVGVGGAWGMGAAPGTTLAKLIEAQERQQQQQQQQQQQMMMMNNNNNNNMNPMMQNMNPMMQQQMMMQQQKMMMMMQQQQQQQKQMPNQFQMNNNNNNMGMFNGMGSSSNNNSNNMMRNSNTNTNPSSAFSGMGMGMGMGMSAPSAQSGDDGGGFGAPMGGSAPHATNNDAFSSLGGMNAFR